MTVVTPLTNISQESQLCGKAGIPVTRFRLTVTSSCMFKCFFCHKEGLEVVNTPELSVKEIESLVRTASNLGVTNVKLVGGEALIRRDLEEIVSVVAEHVEEVSLTTNGFGFTQRAVALQNAGLRRVNISLHSLTRNGFKQITGIDAFETVMESIMKAIELDFERVKVNLTLMKGINDHEIPRFIEWAAELGIELQIIELQPGDAITNEEFKKLHYDLRKIREELIAEIHLNGGNADLENDRYSIVRNGKQVNISLLRLCNNTTRCASSGSLQVTSDGKLKPCFWRNDNLVSVGSLLTNDFSPCLKCALKTAASAVENECPLEREEIANI
ncbi:MAG: GTP 3',8-cyclase MoaA [Candidatus Thorarchaeota archaeon]